MYLEFLARFVLSSSLCPVVLRLLSPILFRQCGHLSFFSLRIVSLPRQIRPHVDPPYAPRSRVPRAHLLDLAQLELLSSLSLALSRRCTTSTTSCVTVSLDVSRQHVESSRLSLRNSCHHTPWKWRSRSFFVCGRWDLC